jgi:hypothetical protein
MLGSIERHWQEFAHGKPGRRFEDRYNRQRHHGERPATRIIGFTAGIALSMLGLILLVAPGPGVLLLLVGGGLIAQQSLSVARALDRVEVWLRNVLRRRL